jgi:hypothetical protein
VYVEYEERKKKETRVLLEALISTSPLVFPYMETFLYIALEP